MKNLTNPVFIASAVLALAALVLYVTKTGYHKTSIIAGVTAYLIGCVIVSLFFPVPGLILTIVSMIGYFIYFRKLTAGMKADEGEWIYYEDFEADYAAHPEDFSGCYVILTFPEKKNDSRYDNYETAYVGSSSSLRKEVHGVLTNKTLSRVYDDIQNGKHPYIKLVQADAEHINSIQEKLITMYNGVPYLLSFKEVREKRKNAQL